MNYMDIETPDLLPLPDYDSHREVHARTWRELMELRQLVTKLFTAENLKEFIETQKQLKTIVLGEEKL